MNKTTAKRVLALALIAIALLVVSVVIFLNSEKPPESFEKKGKASVGNSSTHDQQTSSAGPKNSKFNSPQWQKWQKRNAEDSKWEWKVPIKFYGQILDQNDSPVEGAKVTLSWTDLSVKGVSLREISSDGHGRFILDDVNGKHLLVRSIEKQGYEYATTNRDGFEYAAFFAADYYVPDSKKPVVFRMHKRAKAEALIVVSNKYRVPANGTIAVDLKTGQLGGNDVFIELVNNSDPTGKEWEAKISAPGGLQIASDEFAAVAPESGYKSELTIDQNTVQPSGFQSGSLYKGGKFFVKTSSGYALVEFRMVPGNKSVNFTSYLNPIPGSRNLEFDPSKVVKSL
jgi:hypothetical protein